MADAVAFVDDLFFLAKITETARHTGAELRAVSDRDAFLREAAANPGATLLLDLNARGKPLEALARIREDAAPLPTRRRVIAFLSHVQTDLAEQARAAGCDEVMPRSEFTMDLPRILRESRSVRT
jgi:CheY-like chemotaxis protein